VAENGRGEDTASRSCRPAGSPNPLGPAAMRPIRACWPIRFQLAP
jgi:hypothetical protein